MPLMMAWRVPYDNSVLGWGAPPPVGRNVPQGNNLACRFCQFPHNKGLSGQNIDNKAVVACPVSREKAGRESFGFAQDRPGAHANDLLYPE